MAGFRTHSHGACLLSESGLAEARSLHPSQCGDLWIRGQSIGLPKERRYEEMLSRVARGDLAARVRAYPGRTQARLLAGMLGNSRTPVEDHRSCLPRSLECGAGIELALEPIAWRDCFQVFPKKEEKSWRFPTRNSLTSTE